MPFDYKSIEQSVRARFGAEVLDWTQFRSQYVLHLRRNTHVKVMTWLRDEPAMRFEMLTDVTCMDNLKLPEQMQKKYQDRFTVIYQLYSLLHNDRLRVKVYVPEEPCELESVSGIWASALWGEREAFDMFGVVFTGHPDLRRILMPDTYEGHPLRKDYPLKGRGERDNFPKYTEIPEDGQ